MSKIYMAVTVEQDKNERLFEPRPSEEYEPGYYSYVVSANIGDNLKFALDCIGGLRAAHLCRTKAEAKEIAAHWNECYKQNGTYLFTERSL